VEQPSEKPTEGMWTIDETAFYLKVSTAWVRRRVNAGKLTGYMLEGSNRLRFVPDDVRAFALAKAPPQLALRKTA
jgi:excisionase family DNA binding protein